MDEARQANAPFERVGRREYGYNTRQVDEFLAKARSYYNSESTSTKAITSRNVRSMAFDPAKAGYEPQAVDAALDRLEDVFAQRERDQLIQDKGEEAWLLQIGRSSAVLRARLHRKPGERFRRPSKRKVPSYNVEDVDALCNELLDYFENDKPLSVDVVRRAVFREAKGAEGYEETQVDAFLDRVVELMASID
ncbi:DivIVA domain-containing protein [Arthrobacter sp. zg-Y820]|uniref:DivIVA domain-containing protein n=1 Tax=unclassified Arthrobacter TaxID=235627 RepID=UPI001E5A0485|nr:MULTISPECIES: DivIVA domain-containing protein [unclassified Arthrobacter]MCC9198125.1 DivIVA domain-containing protein [Arthrobacter sp. zg-Y820]MDK1280992.1 DivIVA domain-containing protein [Arthrobacter sp. zg.Y820]WIB10462.1 DivIVA domain-containing protein [Arthrobacter sp. zg-Y820]